MDTPEVIQVQIPYVKRNDKGELPDHAQMFLHTPEFMDLLPAEIHNVRATDRKFSVNTSGFDYARLEDPPEIDYLDPKQVKEVYFPRLEKLLKAKCVRIAPCPSPLLRYILSRPYNYVLDATIRQTSCIDHTANKNPLSHHQTRRQARPSLPPRYTQRCLRGRHGLHAQAPLPSTAPPRRRDQELRAHPHELGLPGHEGRHRRQRRALADGQRMAPPETRSSQPGVRCAHRFYGMGGLSDRTTA